MQTARGHKLARKYDAFDSKPFASADTKNIFNVLVAMPETAGHHAFVLN